MAETYFEMVYMPDKGICMVNRTSLKWTAFEKGKDMVPLSVFCRIGYVIGLGFIKTATILCRSCSLPSMPAFHTSIVIPHF